MSIRIQHQKPVWSLCIGVLLITTFWGGWSINQDAIWYDELTSISHAGGVDDPFTFTEVMISITELSPKHSPLYFLMLNLWSKLVGWHPLILRWLTVLLGIVSVAGIYQLGKDIQSPQLGLFSALLMGTSVFYLTTYHEIRMYVLLVNLTILTLWAYLKVIQNHQPVSCLMWLVLIAGLDGMLYTQPFSIFLPISLGIYHVVFVPKTTRWFKIVGAFILAAIVYLPWLPITLWGVMTKFDTGGVALDSLTALHVFGYLMGNGNWILLVGLVGLGIRYIKPENRELQAVFILAIISLASLLIGNSLVGLIPLHRARYFYVIWALWVMVMAFGITRLKYRWLQAMVLVIWIVSGLILQGSAEFTNFQGAVKRVQDYPQFHNLIADLSSYIKPDDYLLSFTNTEFVHSPGKRQVSTSEFYLRQFLEIDGRFVRGFETEPEAIRLDVIDKVRDKPVIVFAYPKADLPSAFDVTLSTLQENYTFCERVVDGQYFKADRYSRHGLNCGLGRTIIRYDEGITAEYQSQIAEDRVTLTTAWTLADSIESGQVMLSLQVINSQGANVKQQDFPLLNASPIQWISAIFETSDLPPDSYQIVAIVYASDDGQRLSGIIDALSLPSDMIPLVQLSIGG